MMLPPRSRKLIEATPLHKTEAGVKACIEFTIYRDGHAGLAVSRIEGEPPARRVVQADMLPLNDVAELQQHIDAVVEHVRQASGAKPHV